MGLVRTWAGAGLDEGLMRDGLVVGLMGTRLVRVGLVRAGLVRAGLGKEQLGEGGPCAGLRHRVCIGRRPRRRTIMVM